MLPMKRTPTNSVTAIAIAARAFAWGISCGAYDPDHASGVSPLPLLR
jgi:hypothetical protein